MSTPLLLQLFGPPRFAADGAGEVAPRKGIALLAYLAAEGTAASRDSLAALLWPEFAQERARANLRRTLFRLNRTPIEPLLAADRESVAIGPNGHDAIDVIRFDRLRRSTALEEIGVAAGLYEGEFLAGFALPDSAPFEEWATLQRESYRREALRLLERLTTTHLEREEFDAAIQHARRQLELDPLREAAWRRLMEALAGAGRRAEALAAFERCRDWLRAELSVEPSPETVALAERLRAISRPSVLEAVSIDAPPPAPPLEMTDHPVASPYRGLLAFTEADAPFFFGREGVIDLLVQAVAEQSIVAVIGSSGSGKSSVVHAGLLPVLRPDPSWVTATFRPGERPTHALAAALIPLLEDDLRETERLIETRALATALDAGSVALLDVVERILDKSGGRRFLLVVDQFEELFTLGRDHEARERFLDTLLELVFHEAYREPPRFTLLFTLRAAFLNLALDHPPLAEAIQGADVKVGAMSRAELERAIVHPSALHGVGFESGLVTRMLDELGREPGHLPLLQFALASLWERRRAGQITHEAYDAIGGVSGALTEVAEGIFGALDEEERRLARRVFVQLVRPGEGGEDTRRLASREELGDGTSALVERLVDARLLVTGRDPEENEIIEVAHEALIRGWPRLRGWMEEDRAFRLWQERLRTAIQGWQSAGRDKGALLRGVPLATAEQWLAERPDELSVDERGFVAESVAQRERRSEARERRRRRTVGALVAGLALVTLLAGLAATQWRQATTERDLSQRARSQQLAAQADALRDERLDQALLLAAEALRIADTAEARAALQAALDHRGAPRFFRGHASAVGALGFSPDGTRLATASEDGTFRLWDLATGTAFGEPIPSDSTPSAVAFSADGERLVTGTLDGTLVMRDARSGDPVAPAFNQGGGPVYGLLFPASDRRLLTFGCTEFLTIGCGAAQAILWDLERRAPIDVQQRTWIGPVSGSLDGAWYAFATPEGELTFYDAASGEQSGETIATGLSNLIWLSPDYEGRRWATGTQEGTIQLWDRESGRALSPPLAAHRGTISGLAFSPDGRWLLSGDESGTLLLWDLVPSTPVATPLTGYERTITSLTWDRAGASMAVGHVDGVIVLRDLPAPGTLRQLDTGAASFALSPDGVSVAIGGADGEVQLRELSSGEPGPLLETGAAQSLTALAFSADGSLLAGGDRSGALTVWESATWTRRAAIDEGEELPIADFAFDPDERVLHAIDEGRRTYQMDLETGELITEPRAGPESQTFSPSLLVAPGVRLAAGGTFEGPVILWDPMTGELDGPPLEGATLPIAHVELDPGGRIVAGGGCGEGNIERRVCESGEIRLWDLTSRRPLGEPLVGNPGGVNSVAFSPDGRLLATGDSSVSPSGATGNLVVWDVASRQPLTPPIRIPGNTVFAVEFTTDGSAVVVLSRAGGVYLWPLSAATTADPAASIPTLTEQLADLCRRVGRSMSEEEWRRFLGDEPYRETCPDAGDE